MKRQWGGADRRKFDSSDQLFAPVRASPINRFRLPNRSLLCSPNRYAASDPPNHVGKEKQ